MKNLLRLSILLMAIAILNSCKRDLSNVPIENTSKDGVTFHKLTINGNETIIKESNGNYYFSDDEMLSARQFNILKKLATTGLSTVERSAIVSDFTKKWPGGIWYYKIQSTRTPEILTAMSWISANSNIVFVERTTQTDYVTIYDTNDQSSWSNKVGMENGTKEIHISTIQGTGTIAHEIMHSLGFFHEQARPDRDNYIRIFNLPNNQDIRAQFNIKPEAQTVGSFDFNSIMAYQSYPYMEKLDGSGWPGNRDSLSSGDKQGLATLYGAKISGPDQICTEGIFTVSSGALTIANSNGVATLTSLGNNRWKVTRIGNANGKIRLNSAYATYKEVSVGSYNDIINNGGTTMQGGINTTLFSEISSTTYTWQVSGGIIVSGQGTQYIVVRPYVNGSTNVSNNFEVTVTYSDNCGTYTTAKTFWVPPGGGGVLDPGEGI